MELTSSAFTDSGMIPAEYTCDGADINPPLEISDVPMLTMSLALIVEDPDAPHPNFTHWVIWNIKPTTTTIKEGEVPPDAVEGNNDFVHKGYGGPCPPSGTHRYVFTLYALSDILDLPEKSMKPDLHKAMDGKIIKQATLTGLYRKF
jgi:Raf kinase inhibitor-like YbhB/YbcL family protein